MAFIEYHYRIDRVTFGASWCLLLFVAFLQIPALAQDGAEKNPNANSVVSSNASVLQSSYHNLGLSRIDPEEFQKLRAKRTLELDKIRDLEDAIKSTDLEITALQKDGQDIRESKPDQILPFRIEIAKRDQGAAREDIKSTEDQLTELSKKGSLSDTDINHRNELQARISSLRLRLSSANSLLREAEEYDSKLNQYNENYKKYTEKLQILQDSRKQSASKLLAAQRTLVSTDDEISRMFFLNDNINTFRLVVTIVFTILVAFVILGFFYIARINIKIQEAIFSGQSGIQFITLFSLVIAIILFGVMNILEAKELAALLGGLSGYILGRGGSMSSTGNQPSATMSPPLSHQAAVTSPPTVPPGAVEATG